MTAPGFAAVGEASSFWTDGRLSSAEKPLIAFPFGSWPCLAALTYCHIEDMVFHIKTTLNIDDTVMARLRREAVRRRQTMSALVEAGLRLLFQSGSSGPVPKLPALPKLRSGGHQVDVADRDALLRTMDEI